MQEANTVTRIPVALLHCADYNSPALPGLVRTLLETIGWRPSPGTRVLVKPNLLAPKPPEFLSCTHPLVVRSACEYLLDLGARVTVGDSPSFGTGTLVAQKIGLTRALADLPVALIDLNRPRLAKLSSQGWMVAISQAVLEHEVILNLPKLKVHRMMALSGAVKNHFGCVTSLWKAFLHATLGDRGNRFESMLMDLANLLPPSVSLLDAVTAMHVTGPVDGHPFPMELLAASTSAVALDTAIYTLLQLTPANVPLWQEAVRRNIFGASPADLIYPLELLASFDGKDFLLPSTLQPLSFHPIRLAKRFIKNTLSACSDNK
jgi:uncharacterized protein (DUF362 family)